MAKETGAAAAKRSQVVSGMFKGREDAERAYQSLQERGYSKDEINVIMSEDTRDKYFPEGSEAADTELGSKAAEGAGKGAAIGGGTGAIIGALVGSGIPEEHAKQYEEGVKQGGIYMGVNPRTDEDAEYFERSWSDSRGEVEPLEPGRARGASAAADAPPATTTTATGAGSACSASPACSA